MMKGRTRKSAPVVFSLLGIGGLGKSQGIFTGRQPVSLTSDP